MGRCGLPNPTIQHPGRHQRVPPNNLQLRPDRERGISHHYRFATN